VAGADEVTSLTQTIHELAGKGTAGLTLTATPLFGALALERQMVLFNSPPVFLNSPSVVLNSPPVVFNSPSVLFRCSPYLSRPVLPSGHMSFPITWTAAA